MHAFAPREGGLGTDESFSSGAVETSRQAPWQPIHSKQIPANYRSQVPIHISLLRRDSSYLWLRSVLLPATTTTTGEGYSIAFERFPLPWSDAKFHRHSHEHKQSRCDLEREWRSRRQFLSWHNHLLKLRNRHGDIHRAANPAITCECHNHCHYCGRLNSKQLCQSSDSKRRLRQHRSAISKRRDQCLAVLYGECVWHGQSRFGRYMERERHLGRKFGCWHHRLKCRARRNLHRARSSPLAPCRQCDRHKHS